MPITLQPDQTGLARAVERLRAHEPVVMPTETVYGLACGTLDPLALSRVFQLKDRPADNPLIAHVTDTDMAKALVADWDDRAKALCAAFWPGPLTLILPRRGSVPAMAAGGRDTLAVRMPEHPVAQALLRAFGGPLSAPSANRTGRVSPTTVAHVAADYLELPEAADLLMLDGGDCAVGVESTVVSLAYGAARLLRPGSVRLQQIEGVIGDIEDTVPWAQEEAPGSSPRHYAPLTPVCLFEHDAPQPDGVLVDLPDDPARAQAELYGLLRAADELATSLIVIKMPPDEPCWRAVRDRLHRAAWQRTDPADG